MHFLPTALAVLALGVVGGECAWPDGPLVTENRWILDAQGRKVTFVGANWPGAGAVMLPEGLQYTSIEKVITDIKSLGMNAIRLTYAIQMIDDVLDEGGDVKISDAFKKALGEAEGLAVLNKVLEKNPSFTAETTRLQVFDAVAAECAKQQIHILLDNHVSKAQWCCSAGDVNSWFGDSDFDVKKWRRGLAFMADHGKKWPALSAMSLRNELRGPADSKINDGKYNWKVWYDNMVPAAGDLHTANKDVLILFSGLDFDNTLKEVVEGTNLGGGTVFKPGNFTFANKVVFELHNYERNVVSCDALTSGLIDHGYSTLGGKVANTVPMIMTEFGFPQEESSRTSTYATCLLKFLTEQKGGWFVWAIAGSYYIRQTQLDDDEDWGLYTKDWSSWRLPANVQDLRAAAAISYA